MPHIRNFAIISHVDHGKSTLADRFLELTGTIERRNMRAQFLDQMELEREKGITIKMQPVRMSYRREAITYQLNLIDTPGHVDFSYEVSRALACVEGAIVLVDATQGVQAQTVANVELAFAQGLTLVPAVNKIDLPSAEPDRVAAELADLLGVDAALVRFVSAKTGEGVEGLLKAVIETVPAPRATHEDGILRALIFDSTYDAYLGVVAHVRVCSGIVRRGDPVQCAVSGATAKALDVGVFLPERSGIEALGAGEIGYVATGLKEAGVVRVGDTMTRNADTSKYRVHPLPGYREPLPMVYASVFPKDQDAYDALADALGKLKLEDSALSFEAESAGALGRGFRAGFLGLLHMEIVAERLRREHGLALTFSTPSVAYRVRSTTRGEETVYAAHRMPPQHEIIEIREPWVVAEVITPPAYLGAVTVLVAEHAGAVTETLATAGGRVLMRFESPLREVIVDFHDQLKSATQGFASMSYVVSGERVSDLVRLEILVAEEEVVAFAEVVPRSKAERIGRERVEKLKTLLPRQLFSVALQARVQGRIIARETIPAMRKDVTGYLYGGDRTRKMKLWKKQKEGKERLREGGRVNVPPAAFFEILKIGR